MQNHYNEKARQTYNQEPTRIYVKKRRRIINQDILKYISLGLIMAGCIYGINLIESGALDRKRDLDDSELEYIREMNQSIVSQEDIDKAEREYVEKFYSIETIKSLNENVIKDYKYLKTLIIENEIEDFIEEDEMDNDRVVEVLYERANFEKSFQNPEGFTEIERKKEAYDLYELRKSLLNRQIEEIKLKQQKHNQQSIEYSSLQQEISTISKEIERLNLGTKTLTTEALNDAFRR